MHTQPAVQTATTEPASEIEQIYRSIIIGEKKWDDYTFLERTCKGWLLPYLLDLDLMFARRWDYWLMTLEAGKLLDRPIPRLYILSGPEEGQEAEKMLMKCLEHNRAYSQGITLIDFLEWLLWGFGDPGQEQRPRKVSEDLNEFWYRTFNMGLLLKYPKDYFGDIYSEERSPRTNQRSGFFPTPDTVCECMVRMHFDGITEDTRTLSVCEPCVGTGRMLMHASNYSLNLWGMDIDYGCVLACRVNGYLYMPWLMRPAPWLDNGLKRGDALRKPFLELVQPKDHPSNVISLYNRQLSLFDL